MAILGLWRSCGHWSSRPSEAWERCSASWCSSASAARRAAGLDVPDPAPFDDALIAATALVHGLVVVTGNVRDFARSTDLAVHDLFSEDAPR